MTISADCFAELALRIESRVGTITQMLPTPYLVGYYLRPWPTTLLLWSVVKCPTAIKTIAKFSTEMERNQEHMRNMTKRGHI